MIVCCKEKLFMIVTQTDTRIPISVKDNWFIFTTPREGTLRRREILTTKFHDSSTFPAKYSFFEIELYILNFSACFLHPAQNLGAFFPVLLMVFFGNFPVYNG